MKKTLLLILFFLSIKINYGQKIQINESEVLSAMEIAKITSCTYTKVVIDSATSKKLKVKNIIVRFPDSSRFVEANIISTSFQKEWREMSLDRLIIIVRKEGLGKITREKLIESNCTELLFTLVKLLKETQTKTKETDGKLILKRRLRL